MDGNSAYQTELDIANRTADALGLPPLQSLEDDTKIADYIRRNYHKKRQAELRRNVWRFAIRKAVLYPINTPVSPSTSTPTSGTVAENMPTMLLVPPLWSAGAVYNAGAIVQDSSGLIWTTTTDANVGNEPGTDGSEAWDSYFGSLCVQPYDVSGTTSYWPGDLVYTTNDIGQTQIFLALITAGNDPSNESLDPRDANVWSSTVLYSSAQIVTDGSYFWYSTIDLNQGNQPGFYTDWSSTVTYAASALVGGSDGNVYSSIAGTNLNHNPVGDGGVHWTATGNRIGSWEIWQTATTYASGKVVAGIDGLLYRSLSTGNLGHDPTTTSGFWQATGTKNPWTPAFSTGVGNDQWLSVFGTLTKPNIVYPLSVGPSRQSETRNIFLLPNGFLRQAPKDPKAGSASFLGAPTGLMYDDWVIEGNYILSQTPWPITLRFVADVRNVAKMDAMFAEGLGLRVALDGCELITQAGDKIAGIGTEYNKFMGEARIVNGIETGPTEPYEDDYVSCRI